MFSSTKSRSVLPSVLTFRNKILLLTLFACYCSSDGIPLLESPEISVHSQTNQPESISVGDSQLPIGAEVQIAPTTTVSPESPHIFSSNEVSDEDYESEEDSSMYDYYSEEFPCSKREFWHIRGRRCVPFVCPRANHLRSWKTGECLFQELPGFGGGKDNMRVAFKSRVVLTPQKVRTRGRGGHLTSKWVSTQKKTKVSLDEDTANPIKSLNLIG